MIENKTEIVAYKLADEKFKELATAALINYLKVNDLPSRNKTPNPNSFATGSAFHRLMTANGMLDVWYEPVHQTVQTIAHSIAKTLPLQWFFEQNFNTPWEITNDDGSKHKDSDKFILAIKVYNDANKTINEILSEWQK